MKEIIVNSKKYGIKIIKVDDDDYEMLSKYKWHICVKNKKTNIFYALTNYGRATLVMHRLIMANPSGVVDHIDRDGLNNCKINLRVCTRAQNCMNSIGKREPNRYKGVFTNKHAKGYFSQIVLNRKPIYLGRFKTKMEAAMAYNEAAKKYHGEFAKLNDI